jgi:hypothetical protein
MAAPIPARASAQSNARPGRRWKAVPPQTAPPALGKQHPRAKKAAPARCGHRPRQNQRLPIQHEAGRPLTARNRHGHSAKRSGKARNIRRARCCPQGMRRTGLADRFLAKLLFGSDIHAIAGDQHADHQIRINRGPVHAAAPSRTRGQSESRQQPWSNKCSFFRHNRPLAAQSRLVPAPSHTSK